MSPREAFLPRLVGPRVSEALEDEPVVLLHGPRQAGKTTLVQRCGDHDERTYITFDDDALREAAAADPIGFVRSLPERVTLDEIQRVPELFTAIKAAVDGNRTPGRFLLTGSANVFAVPRLADSLAGRMSVLRLYPLAQVEIERTVPTFIDQAFSNAFSTRTGTNAPDDLATRIVGGGYPPAVARTDPRRRARWYRDYVTAVTQRDVRDLSRIAAFDALPRLMELASSQTARLVNVAELAAPFALTRQTIDAYVTLLRNVFLLDLLPAWHINRLKRLVKAPKLHIGDTGLAAAVLGLDAHDMRSDRHLYGQLVETFAFHELRRHASGRTDDVRFAHYRDRDGYEVEIILERGGRQLVGIEVKAAATVRDRDFAGLRRFARAAGDRFTAGVVLYDGDALLPFGDRLYAVPISDLWRASSQRDAVHAPIGR